MKAYIPPDNVIPRTVGAAFLFVVALAAAVALRAPGLENRPMHTDEAVLATKLGELVETGRWVYDPTEYHGPTLPYSGLVVSWLAGADNRTEISKTTVRVVAVLYGIGLVLLLPLVGDGIGRLGVGWAALLTAVSPMCVYFSRYFIMEVLFVFFTFGMIGCGWRYFMSRRAGWLVAAGVFAGLVHATKETCIITFFAVACGVAGTLAADFFARGTGFGVIDRNRKVPLQKRHFLWAALAAAATSALLFSSFFTNPQGIWHSIETYRYYFVRSEGSGHEQPWFYYFQTLGWTKTGGMVWSEAAALALAMVGAAVAFVSKPERRRTLHLVRFLAIYTLISFAVYSVIRYKTPWTIMSAHHGAIVLAGFGAARLIGAMGGRLTRNVTAALIAAAIVNLGIQAKRGSFRFPAHPRNPYVYSHTTTNFEKLVERLGRFRALKDAGDPLTVQVVHPEFAWPLQWYLRGWDYVGYRNAWDPVVKNADVIVIASGDYGTRADEMEATHTFDGPWGLHPGSLLTLFVRQPLWDKFLEEQKLRAPR